MAKKKTTSTDKANPVNNEKTVASNAVAASSSDVKAGAAKTSSKPEVKTAPASRIFEVRKPEARKNVLPINVEEEIRRRAYELYVRRGLESGNQADDWLSAEREVMQRYHQHSA